MKTVAMTAKNRPEYLRRTLAALRVAAFTVDGVNVRWRIQARIEPSGVTDLVKDLMAAFGVDRFLNDSVLGPHENPRRVIADAFEDMHTSALPVPGVDDCVLYLQDDCVLSPDALELVDWWLVRPESRDPDCLCLWLLNYESDPARPVEVLKSRGEKALELQGCRFHSGGAFAMTRRQWEELILPNWSIDARGCDWSLGELLERSPSIYAMVPALSRCKHIGKKGGTFCQTAVHDRLFRGLAISDHQNTLFRVGQ